MAKKKFVGFRRNTFFLACFGEILGGNVKMQINDGGCRSSRAGRASLGQLQDGQRAGTGRTPLGFGPAFATLEHQLPKN